MADIAVRWQPVLVPTDVEKLKATPSQVLEDMARLTARQLEEVLQQAALLRLQKRKRLMSARESELLRVINRGLSPEKSFRLEQLEHKLREGTINASEQQQLLRFTEELERLSAHRLKALINLAALRGTTLAKLMRELGLHEQAYG